MPNHLENVDLSCNPLYVVNILNLVLFEDLDSDLLGSQVVDA